MDSLSSRRQVIQELSQQLRQFERSRQRRPGAGARAPSAWLRDQIPDSVVGHGTPESLERQTISTGVAALDRLLPAGGLLPGTLAEWLADRSGAGAGTLALMGLRQVLEQDADHRSVVVVDERGEFYPPAAAGWGIDLERMIVVRPEQSADAVWAVEQSLRCGAVAAVLCWIEKGGDRLFRRLQLAAETGGGIGILIRPATARRQPSWADVRWLVQPASWQGAWAANRWNPLMRRPAEPERAIGRRLHVELLHCRGMMAQSAVELEISDETGLVSLVPELADPTFTQHAAGA